ncbi:MAG: aldo/keto reductase [Muribaculaceae bacterium]|nr:aldo/keto reductase [Muribaculaceae bacterium]
MSKHDISKQADTGRRRFLRNAGIFAAAGALAACGVKSSADSSEEAPEGGMTMRRNPSTGDEVSILGFGCMRFPTIGMRDGTDDDTLDQEAINELIDAALEGGVNYFDTSPAYCKGMSEAATGAALARHPRDSYFIATKLSNFAPATWSREKSQEMFEASLRNLRTDYIDYLLLHGIGMGGMENWNGRYIANGMLDYLLEQRSKGVVRNLGFSYHGDVEVFDHLLAMMDRGEVKWDFAQIQLNYIDWHHAKEINPRNTDAEYLYGELHRRGIPTVIMEPLLGGRLASVPKPIARKMKERQPDSSIASWAFRYAGTPEGVLTVLSGMNRMEHLRDNIATYSPLKPLSADEDAFLQRCAVEILENNTVPCTDCKYCMPCPYGVDIPAVFAHYNRCINDDFVPRDTLDPNYDRARRAFLYGYDKAVPRLRQASRCIACGACVSHCPQAIPIPATLRKIDRYTEALKQGKI